MFSFPNFLNPEYYRVTHETSVVVIQACLVSFVAGLWIALFAFRSASKERSAQLFWCGCFALLFALWNLFFLSSYAQRDLELWNTSLSVHFTYRLYLALGLLLASVAHALIKRIYHARYFLSNTLHFWTISLAILILFVPLPVEVGFVTLFYGLVSFSAFAWINWRVWKRYLKAKDLYQKTRGLFLSLGLTITIVFSALGQLRAENLLPFPFPYLGSVFTVVFIYFVLQMLLNPRLREIRELMLGGIRVILLTIVLGVIFLSLLAWVGENEPELFLFNTFLAAFIILNVLEPIRDKLDNFIMRRFIVDRNELEGVLRETRRRLRSARSTANLATTILTGLKKSDRIYRCGLYLWDNTTLHYRLMPKSNLGTAASLSPQHPAIEIFKESPDYVLMDSSPQPNHHNVLKEMRSHLGFPIFYEEDLIGMLFLRTSLSAKNPYTSFSQAEVRLFKGLLDEVSAVLYQLKHFEKQDQQQRLAALGEMSAALAHEIRNPLGAIQGATHLLASSPTLENQEDRECVGILRSEIERLQGTVEQYLQFARRSETKMMVNLKVLIEKSIQSAKPKAEKSQTQIQWSPPEADFTIATDPLKLEQVLINLMVNACEAFSKNLWIKLESNHQRPDSIRIVLKDDGPGIPPEILSDIFTPLFTTKSAGSGLGLPICKKIIDSLGGSLRVESRLNAGTSFVIEMKRDTQTLPAQKSS